MIKKGREIANMYFSTESDDLRSLYEDTGKVVKFERELKLKNNKDN